MRIDVELSIICMCLINWLLVIHLLTDITSVYEPLFRIQKFEFA
jgi:hypothetical protein